MRPTKLLLSGQARQPMIHFIGKRQWKPNPDQHPHPAAPASFQKSFSDFLKKFRSSGSTSRPQTQSEASKRTNEHDDVYREFWQAPERLWNPRVRRLSEEEMDAILSGGATLH